MQREKAAGGITAGLMLIGIGVLAFTDRWWPGILVVIGVAVIGGMLFRGQFLSTLPVALIFFGVPAIIQLGLSWNTFAPLLLIGLGLLSLVDNLRRSRRRAAGDGTSRHFEYRSGFWPVIFLGVGTIWLLGNLGYIQAFNPYALLSLWPLLLIGLGLDLLIGRRSVWIGALLGLAILAVAGFLLFTRDDLRPQVELLSAHFSEPVGQASTAEITLKLGNGQNTLFALEDGGNLSIGFPQEASFNFRVVMGDGDLVFEIPSQADARVEVLRHDGGDVSLPADFALTQGQPGDEGIWESPGFGQAAQQIVITVDDINGGDVVVR